MKNLIQKAYNKLFKYDAVNVKGRRRNPTVCKQKERIVINEKDRIKMGATAYDLIRNDPVAWWAFNKYLDYITGWTFQAKTSDGKLNQDLEFLFSEWSKKHRCDALGKLNFREMIRTFGSSIALDGDAGIWTMPNGQIYGIESDRIHTPSDHAKIESIKDMNIIDGLVTDDIGRVLFYVICNRTEVGNSYNFAELIPYEEMVFAGNFFRFDQLRGVTKFSPSLNIFQDVKEIDEFQLIKCKKHALMAIAQKSSDSSQTGFNEQITTETTTDGETISNYFYNIGAPAMKLDIDKDDEIDLIESKNPSSEYQSFSETMMRKAILVFGQKYSFFDSRQSSYSAMKQDRAESRSEMENDALRIHEAMTKICDWIVPKLMRENGIKTDENQVYELIQKAEPWLDEKSEVEAALLRINGGLSDYQHESKRRGRDWFDTARELSREQKYIKQSGLNVTQGQPGQQNSTGDGNNEK